MSVNRRSSVSIELGFANTNARAVPSSRSQPNSQTSRMSTKKWRMIFWGSSVLLLLHGIFQQKYTLTIPESSFNDFEPLENRNLVVGHRDTPVNGSDTPVKQLRGNEDAVETFSKEIPNSNALVPLVKSRFPQKSLAILPPTMQDKKVLVCYSGPTELIKPNVTVERMTRLEKMMELYRLNFEFFIQHGIQCQSHDTILVVTDVVASKYHAQIDKLHSQCHQDFGHYVRLVVRNNVCYDLESVRVALHHAEEIGRPAVFFDRKRNETGQNMTAAYYDYFVYVNCGVTGPSPQWAKLPWTNVFLQGLRDGVKMTGITMNCARSRPHIQSMMYAVDREGLQIIVDGGAIHDCTTGADHWKRQGHIVRRYEIGMSNLLLSAGYGISAVLRPTTIFEHNSSKCLNEFGNETLNDIWLWYPLMDYFGKIPSLDEVIFFKTSRLTTPDMAHLINFTGVIGWNRMGKKSAQKKKGARRRPRRRLIVQSG